MSLESPFKFLDAYAKEDSDIFFGRDLEIDEVYNKVFQNKTLFIYGESGTGKSSLINCGLANKFKDTDWLPVNVRRGDNINTSVINELEKLTITKVHNLNGSFSKNLLKYTRSVYLDYFKPIYFIFDQFEELYLMGTKSEWKEFVAGIKSLADRDLQVHFIFIIRAEYLHFMSEFEEELPEIFNNKLRVEKITRLKAKECIEGPCKIFDIKLDDQFIDLLFDQLSPDRNEIELTYLQVYLDRVYKLALQEKGDQTGLIFSKELLDDIGMVSDVLSDFLDEQLESMPDKETTLTILKAFVTVDGTKRQVSMADVLSFSKSLGKRVEQVKAEKVISELLERRILKELPDQEKFELRHDALAQKIFEKITTREKELIEVRQFLEYGLIEYKKRGYVLNDRDMAYVQPHLEVLNLEGDLKQFVAESQKSVQKKQRTRKRVIGIVSLIVILCITSIYGFITARQQRETAEEQRSIAEEQRILAEQNAGEARIQKDNAEQNANLALDAQKQAENSADEASLQASIANQQRKIADQQRSEAILSREEAENQRQIALMQKDSAEVARGQAETYSQLADIERERAEKLSMQSLARSMGIKSAQIPDLELKSLLALQAYKFNESYDGYAFQADIYNGLYQAYKQAQGMEFNVYKNHSAAVTNILSSNDRIFTTGSDGKIFSWNGDLSVSNLLAETGMINSTMALSPDGAKLAVGTSASTILIYDATSGQLITSYPAHGGKVWKILFLDNQTLISSGEDKQIISWDIAIGTSKILDIFPTNVHALALASSSNTLWAGLENGKIIQMNLNTSEKTEWEGRNGDMITQLIFNNAETTLAIGFESGTILLWDPQTFDVVETLPGHTAQVSDIKFSDEDRFLISGGYDRKNLLWNLERIKEPPITWTDQDSFVWAVGFAQGGNAIISGDLNGVIKIYQTEMKTYADRMCDQVSRNLTEKEWESFVRDDIPIEQTCKTN
jgi:WD40 repeat protein